MTAVMVGEYRQPLACCWWNYGRQKVKCGESDVSTLHAVRRHPDCGKMYQNESLAPKNLYAKTALFYSRVMQSFSATFHAKTLVNSPSRLIAW